MSDTIHATDPRSSSADRGDGRPPAVRPAETPRYETEAVVSVGHFGDALSVAFPVKDEAFRQWMRSTGFRWSGTEWHLTRDQRAPDVEGFAAALAHRLIGDRFIVRLTSVKAHARLLAGEFDEIGRRWVLRSVRRGYVGWFWLSWIYEDNQFESARTLPGARWEEDGMYVPRGSADAVLDYAERRGFYVSADAARLVEEHRAALTQTLVLDVRPRRKPDRPAPTPAGEIDASLRDE